MECKGEGQACKSLRIQRVVETTLPAVGVDIARLIVAVAWNGLKTIITLF